ncbi:MAG TPA: hypothetical protein VF160_18250 [Candidatus Dormibacteraeota bacterium]
MVSNDRATRRSVLGRGALMLGSLAGALGALTVGERIKSPPALPMVLEGADWHLQAADLARGRPPKPGDRVTVYGRLLPEGEFHATSIYLDTAVSGAVMEIHNFTLPEGTLVGIGAARPDLESAFTIVGGSGRYQGATGSYLAVQEPLETGGAGTARFKFDLRLGEETNGR